MPSAARGAGLSKEAVQKRIQYVNGHKLAHCNEEPAALAAATSQCMDELMNSRRYSCYIMSWLP